MHINVIAGAALAALITCTNGALAQALEEPLSAIDWLSDSVSTPAPDPLGHRGDITRSALPPPVSVAPLNQQRLDSVGLLPGTITGLPDDLWRESDPVELVRLIRTEHVDTLPAIQDLLLMLMLAELDPPRASPDQDGQLLLARLDKLLEMGALEQAQALLERTDPAQTALFRRWFDISLLTGHEDRACAAMRATPDLAPTFTARIFCLARGGDWHAAALTLETGRALGYISPAHDAVLERFLDDEIEDAPPLPAPRRLTPLIFRMFEAIGEPMPTNALPVAFAQADLRTTTGWKARIEAAERLARLGVLPANQLQGIYTEARPAASGGVWDRVAAVQALDVALLSGETNAVAQALPRAWKEMRRAGLLVPFATLYGARLARLPLEGGAKALAFRAGLLSPDYETVAQAHGPLSRSETLLRHIALGNSGDLPAISAAGLAVQDGFSDAPDSEAVSQILRRNRPGEAILQAAALITEGARGDRGDVARGLRILRHMGLEDTARRAALQFLILEAPR